MVNLIPATASASIDDQTGYWLTAAAQHGDRWGFELLDGEQKPIVQFLYRMRSLPSPQALRSLMRHGVQVPSSAWAIWSPE